MIDPPPRLGVDWCIRTLELWDLYATTVSLGYDEVSPSKGQPERKITKKGKKLDLVVLEKRRLVSE